MGGKKTVLIVINVDWLFILHRMEIAKEVLRQGYEVIVVTNDTGKLKDIKAQGIKTIDLNISRSGTNPFVEFKLFLNLFFIYKNIKPSLVYQITMKPVIYGTIISRILNYNTVNAISGLGYNFTENRRGVVQKVMIKLMKFGFKKESNHLIFENKDDFNELKALEVLDQKNKINLIKGIGVNLDLYKNEAKIKNEKLVILLATRMLWDKGVKEFIEAAKLLKNKYEHRIFFKLCGMVDEGNLESVPEKYLIDNEIEGYLKWFGYQTDMVTIYKNSDIIVLPSYREGMPTVLIEGCGAGKPIITTDAIGCKECVDEGLNGYKVPVKSIKELANAIKKLVNSPEDRIRMGIESRKKAEREFDQRKVIEKHLKIFNSILGNSVL